MSNSKFQFFPLTFSKDLSLSQMTSTRRSLPRGQLETMAGMAGISTLQTNNLSSLELRESLEPHGFQRLLRMYQRQTGKPLPSKTKGSRKRSAASSSSSSSTTSSSSSSSSSTTTSTSSSSSSSSSSSKRRRVTKPNKKKKNRHSCSCNSNGSHHVKSIAYQSQT